jgi:hypothetical protein
MITMDDDDGRMGGESRRSIVLKSGWSLSLIFYSVVERIGMEQARDEKIVVPRRDLTRIIEHLHPDKLMTQ